MTLKIPDTVASVQDLTGLTLEIREYTKWSNHEAIKKKAGATKKSDPPVVSTGASQLLRDWSAKKTLDAHSLDELIVTLSDYAESSPSVTFTLAAPASGDVKTMLVAWSRTNIAPNVLVNFKFNATLLGGLVVQYGSRVFDWSFRRQLLAERARFPEVLRRV